MIEMETANKIALDTNFSPIDVLVLSSFHANDDELKYILSGINSCGIGSVSRYISITTGVTSAFIHNMYRNIESNFKM